MAADVRIFRRQWYRAVLPALFAVAAFAIFAVRVPAGLAIALPGVGCVLLLCLALHGGLTIDRNGLSWFVLRPQWRYRTVPWRDVSDVRRTLYGLLAPLRLTVEPGDHEPVVFGKTRRRTLLVWPNGYTDGEAIWETIQQLRPATPEIAEVP